MLKQYYVFKCNDVKELYKTGEQNKIHGNYFNIDPQFFLFKYFCIVNYSSSLER